MNREIFGLINNLANKNIFLDKVMMFFSKDMIYIFAGILVLVFLLGIVKKDKKTRWVVVNTALLTGINLILVYFIGVFYYVDRPFVHNKVNLLYPHVEDASFPSDHATVTMSIALGINKYNKALGIVLTILSLVVGFSRVYVGHHSPFDIVGSYIIVFITSYIYNVKLSNKVNKIYDKIESTIATKLGITWLYKN
ncbi:MAG TPA: undecaprenyl-diphosphatase [Clostridium sp.]